MGNLSSAIIEARKRHEAEIAERLKRRQARQRAEIERLNAAAQQAEAQAAEAEAKRAPKEQPTTAEPGSPAEAQPAAGVASEASTPSLPLDEPDPAANVEPAIGAAQPSEQPPPQIAEERPTAAEPAVEPAAPEIGEPPAPAPVATPAPVRLYQEPPVRRASRPEPAPRLIAEESFEIPAAADELETPPDGRYLKLRNDIIDRIKPFLTGNQFAVYMEIYRQTIGRGRTAAWFRTRDIQSACNLGSDNTVRDAYPVLEQKRLIRLDPNRRVGSPKGLFITVLSVERALDRLERSGSSAQPPAPAAPARVAVQPAGGGGTLVDRLTRDYGVSPTVAPHLLDRLSDEDRELLPYLLARLDRTIAAGKVHNPAGLLRVWLDSFEAWRPELQEEKRREEEARRAEQAALSRDELMLEWFKETEAETERRYRELSVSDRATIAARGREELLAKSPSVRTWTPEQWENQLEIYTKSEIRRELDGFETWLARRQAD